MFVSPYVNSASEYEPGITFWGNTGHLKYSSCHLTYVDHLHYLSNTIPYFLYHKKLSIIVYF